MNSKKLLLSAVFFFYVFMGVKAQTLCPANIFPLDKDWQTFVNHEKLPKGVTYIKDIHHLLDKYEGTWTGQFNDKTYLITFNKKAVTHYGITIDKLIMRYKITSASGQILINTLNSTLDDALLVRGWLLNPQKKYYILKYFGKEYSCGQHGKIFINILSGHPTKMKFVLVSTRSIINLEDCPNGKAPKMFPVSNQHSKDYMVLTKIGSAPKLAKN